MAKSFCGNSFSVHVRDAGGEWNNRVESISNSTDLSGSSTKLTTTYIKKSWTEYNDGHNSGLDADTVDSLHASSFIRNDDSSDQTIPSNLTISKQLNLTQTSTTIGGTNLGNASLLVGSSEQGIGIDGNEIYASGDNLYLGVIDADDIVFRTNNGSESQSTTKAVLNSSGKFVIGRSSAVAEFSVYSGTQGFEVRPNNGSAGNGTLIEYLSRDTNNAQTGYNNHRSIAAEHKFDVNNGSALSTGLFIGSSGDVGIGTTSPAAILHTQKDSNGLETGLIVSNYKYGFTEGNVSTEDLAENAQVSIDFGLSRNTGAKKSNAGRILVGKEQAWTNDDQAIDSFMSFGLYVNNNTDTSKYEKMRITSSGNVGIGTTNPKHTLQVVGSSQLAIIQVIQEYLME